MGWRVGDFMADFTGTSGDDILDGTSVDDNFDLTQGGDDRAFGHEGHDDFLFGATLTKRDRIDGGLGTDEIEISGDYSAGLKFSANSMTSVEALTLGAGFSYSFTLNDVNAAPGSNFSVNGLALLAGQNLVVDGSAEDDANLDLRGGAGDDILIGASGALCTNTFVLSLGGNDQVTGGDGADLFTFGFATAFDANDRVRGGLGTDTLHFDGDYSAGLTITKKMVQGIEIFDVGGDFDNQFTIGRGVVETGTQITWSMGSFEHPETLLDARAVDGSVIYDDGPGRDSFIGTAGNDIVRLTEGHDHVEGRDGEDIFQFIDFNSEFTRNDRVDGGDGDDTLELEGGYQLVFDTKTLRSVETITILDTAFYDFTMHDDNVAAGGTLTVNAVAMGTGATDHLFFDGQAETDGMFQVLGGGTVDSITGGALADLLVGGDGNDVLFGREGDDMLAGGLGQDDLSGAAGADTYVYFSAQGSTGPDCDVFVTFNPNIDFIDLPFTVNAVNARVDTGLLRSFAFDDDLEARFPSLGSHRAVLFAPDQGDLIGNVYLIVEDGGPNGYQAGLDYVFDVTNANAIDDLTTATFI
jgi:hypothetical protein